MGKARIFNRQGTKFWLRLKPNPGFQVGKYHWCAFGGRHDRKKAAKLQAQREVG